MTNKTDVTCRRVLQAVGARVGTAGMASAASGSSGKPVMVGLNPGASLSVASDQALSVEREIQLDGIRNIVAVEFDAETIRPLRGHPKVDYIVPNDPVQMVDPIRLDINNGAIVTAAAGNSGSEEDGPCEDCVGYPAALENTVAIPATTKSDEIAFFSSTGPQVELGAPGFKLLSSLADGDNTYGKRSGTSMASPHAAGATAALVSQGADPETAVTLLKNAADDIGAPDNYQGAGRLNLIDAVGNIPEPGPFEVSTGSAAAVDETSATLSGTLDSLESGGQADVFFKYGLAGSGLPESVDAGTASETPPVFSTNTRMVISVSSN